MTILFTGVYRKANAHRLVSFIESILTRGGRARLWALDEVTSSLAEFTIGHGDGANSSRFGHLNACAADVRQGERLVLCDDDVYMAHGDFADFLKISEKRGFDFAAPAHSPESTFSHPFLAVDAELESRQVTFCEIGPIICMSTRALERVYPFATQTRFGHGIDVEWAAIAAKNSLSMGIVDRTPMTHLSTPGSGYSANVIAAEQAALEQALTNKYPDANALSEIMHTLTKHY